MDHNKWALKDAKDRAFRMAEAARHQGTPDEFPDVELMLTPSDLLRLVNMARAEEREACAQVCEKLAEECPPGDTDADASHGCAAAIRARGTP
jgi:hypothetical protein